MRQAKMSNLIYSLVHNISSSASFAFLSTPTIPSF